MASTAPTSDDLSVYQGSDVTLQLTVTDTDGAAVDLTGAVVVFTVRKTASDEPPLIRKTSATPTEAVITNPTGGVAEIYIVPADTGALVPADYEYDVWADDLGATDARVILVEPATFTVLDPVRSYPDP